MELTGKTVLITGASQGIGAATARLAGSKGATVLLVARGVDQLEAVAEDVRGAGGSAGVVPADLTDLDATAAAVATIRERHGVPDVIVNNAGAGRWLAVEETQPADAVFMAKLPYLGAFAITSPLLPDMIARNSGWIVNINSPACLVPITGAAAYSASRAAMRSFSASLARELRATGVGATHLIAGKVSSNYFDNNPGSEERVPSASKLMPVMTPEQVADHIVRVVEREKRGEVIVPFMAALLGFSHRFAPFLVEQLIWQTGWTPQR